MNRKLMAIIITAFALTLWQAAASAYVLSPAPQKIISEGSPVSFEPAKVVVSSNITKQDPRILLSLKNIFPELKTAASAVAPKPGGVFIYVADKQDDFVRQNCAAMYCQYIDPAGFQGQEYFLGVKKTGDYTLVMILFRKKNMENGVGDSYGAYYATKTLKQLVIGNTIQEISVHDWPMFQVRGILEGFYGKPWPEASRLDMLNWMSDFKFNIYLYTPKDDHKLRFGWRLDLNEKELGKIKEINDLANKNYVRYCWSLSPGISINYTSPKDQKSAYQKFASVIQAGVKCFSIAFDDVGPNLTPYDQKNARTYWGAQVDFTNLVVGKLLEKYPDVTFAFVPNDYWGNLAMESEYLRYLGKHLDPRLSIGWTGDEIAPDRITSDDAVFYSKFIKRPPFLGDNFPVLDNVNIEGGRLALGPLRGRDPSLYRYVKGFAANAMPLALSSKPAYITVADFTWNPENYDSEKSWVSSMKCVAGEDKYEPLYFFAKNSESSLIWKYDAMDLNEETRAVLRAFQKMPDYDMASSAAALRATFKRFQNMEKELEGIRNKGNSGMLDEMKSWIRKLMMYGKVGEKALDLLDAKYSGRQVSASDIDALEKEWQDSEKNLAVMTRMVMFNFMKQSIALLRGQPLPDKEELKSILGE